MIQTFVGVVLLRKDYQLLCLALLQHNNRALDVKLIFVNEHYDFISNTPVLCDDTSIKINSKSTLHLLTSNLNYYECK